MNLTADQYRAIIKPAKANKYGNRRAYRCGVCGAPHVVKTPRCSMCDTKGLLQFASQAEAKHYDWLRFQLKRGEISNLERQVRFPIDWNGVRITSYVADFVYDDAAGETVVVDVKGVETAAYKIKKRLMAAQYGIEITEVSA